VVHFVVAFFEGADGDLAVLPKPLILNPAGTEGQALINALMATELSIGWPETLFWEVGAERPAKMPCQYDAEMRPGQPT